MTDIFDAQALLEQVDGDTEFLAESIEMLDEDAPALLTEMQQAADAGDAEALVRPAHTLKGMIGNFFAEPAQAAARDVEMMARQGQLDGIADAVSRARLETKKLQAALHAYLEAQQP